MFMRCSLFNSIGIIDTPNVPAGSVAPGHIAADSVTSAHIAAGAVTAAKLSADEKQSVSMPDYPIKFI